MGGSSKSCLELQGRLCVYARNILLFSKREAARAGIVLPQSDARAQHIQTQLSLEPGDTVRVGVVNGLKGTALVKAVQPGSITLAWNAWEDPPPPPPVTLLLAMPRPKALRRLWRQLAELGVARVVLTITATVPHGYATSTALRPHNAILDVLQGLEQAGDTIVPEVVLEPSLAAALDVAARPLGAPPEEATERPGVKKEWGRQQTILPAPPVSFRPQPAAASAPPAADPSAATAPLAEEPVWPLGTTAGDGRGGAEPRVAAPALPGSNLPLVERAAADERSDRLAFITQCLQVRRRQHGERGRQSLARSDARPADANFDAGAPLLVVCHPSGPRLLSDTVVAYKHNMNASGHAVWHASEVSRASPPPPPSPPPPSATTVLERSVASTGNAAAAPARDGGADAASGSDSEASPGSGALGSQGAGAGDYYYGSAGASFMTSRNRGGDSSSDDSQPDSQPANQEASLDSSAATGGSSAAAASLDGFIGLCTEAFNVTDREGFGAAAAARAAAGAAVQEAAQGTTAVDASGWGCGHVVLAVGPERGWTEEELGLLRRRGFTVAGMGARSLSSPTAVVSAVSIVQEALR